MVSQDGASDWLFLLVTSIVLAPVLIVTVLARSHTMSIKSAFKSLFEDAKDGVVEQVSHPSFSSSRLWVLLGFGLLLAWVTKLALTEKNIELIFWLAVSYIAGNSLTRLATIFVNGAILKTKLNLAYKDGKLDDNEAKLLDKGEAAE